MLATIPNHPIISGTTPECTENMNLLRITVGK
jgi:hypothetical protein